jgi:hypothetical protein
MWQSIFWLVTATSSPPLEIRVEVALCDKDTQGVVAPANPRQCSAALPGENVYWGALYGVKTHLPSALHAKREPVTVTDDERSDGVVERFVLHTPRATVTATAWADMGHAMRAALTPPAGTALVVFAGHNGLMDMPVASLELAPTTSTAAVSVLACLSARYFADVIAARGLAPYVLTKSLMAPEAYVVAAVVRAFVDGKPAKTAVDDAAASYATFQHISKRAAHTVFASVP